MTLEGEYYWAINPTARNIAYVAILMTLEGEYYLPLTGAFSTIRHCRNPHDIGRRILHNHNLGAPRRKSVAILMTLEGEYYFLYNPPLVAALVVAILMTLEGEYYRNASTAYAANIIVAILMTLEGEYYVDGCFLYNPPLTKSQSS